MWPKILSLFLLGATCTAAATTPVDPFLDEQTVAVVRLDVSRIDLDAIADRFSQFADKPLTQDPEFPQLKKLIADFLAAGGRELYMVVSLADFPGADKPRVIVPIRPDADAQAICDMLVRSQTPDSSADALPPASRVVGQIIDNVVFVGSSAQLQRVQTTTQPARIPHLADALNATGDCTAQAALILTDDSRRVIEAMMPTLPPAVGAAPSTVLTRGLVWASLGIDPPPAMALKLVVQASDPQAATAISGLLTWTLNAMVLGLNLPQTAPDAAKWLTAVAPAVENDQLTLAFDDAQINDLLRALTPAVDQARNKTEQLASMNHIRQILIAIHSYADKRSGQPPSSLHDLTQSQVLNPQFLVNPKHPQQPIGYVYLPPAAPLDRLADPAKTLLIHEAFDTWPEHGLAVGFADGHAELITDQNKFQALRQSAQPTTQPTTPPTKD